MTKQAISALAIILSLGNCTEKTNKDADNNAKSVKAEQTTASATIHEEPVLKYGHIFSGDCAATSLDWPGNYLGTIANNNSYARLQLTLNKDWTYNLKIIALEDLANGDVKESLQKEFKGTFTFDKAGQIIKLLGSAHPVTNDMISLKVEENRLSVLDGNLQELNKDGDMNTLYK